MEWLATKCLQCMIGLMITVSSDHFLIPQFFGDCAECEVVVRGGHFHGNIALQINNDWKPEFSALLMVENLPACIHPINIQVRDENTGVEIPYMITDTTVGESRTWSLGPARKFKYLPTIIDIDFISKCETA